MYTAINQSKLELLKLKIIHKMSPSPIFWERFKIMKNREIHVQSF